jgi:ketosteroid isomerase-like protein
MNFKARGLEIKSKLETVRQIYAAFGRGNISAILEQRDEGVEWEYGSGSNEVPWLQPRRGLAGIGPDFLAGMGLWSA